MVESLKIIYQISVPVALDGWHRRVPFDAVGNIKTKIKKETLAVNS